MCFEIKLRGTRSSAMLPFCPAWLCRFAHRSIRRGCPFGLRAYLAQDSVVNPVFIPPFLRIDLYARDHHAEVNMIAECHTRCTAYADLLLLCDSVAHLHEQLAHV